mmetsp:Transcript_11819/g.17295  ORF Transcript_11819/g.17295 Transcript_11819/m.17295 type:complete len:290 (+) Transcript_11819:499-1368(+)
MLSRGIRSLASKVPARLKSNLLKRESFKTEEDFKKVQELLNYPSDFQTKVKQLIPDSEWDYKNQGKDWGDLCPIGNEQSPTSLHCQEAFKSSQIFNYQYYPLKFNYSPTLVKGEFTKSVYIVRGEFGTMEVTTEAQAKRNFEAVQFHFHAPAEHELDGNLHDLELHLVHRDPQEKDISTVVGFMFKLSQEENPFIEQSINCHTETKPVDLNLLFGTNPEVLMYKGSLTTPPCTEGILWFLSSKILPINKAQLKFFTEKWAENPAFAGGKGNNREVLPLNNRPVIHFDKF